MFKFYKQCEARILLLRNSQDISTVTTQEKNILVTDTPALNGKAERLNWTILKKVQSPKCKYFYRLF